jgi:hypothetical protein
MSVLGVSTAPSSATFLQPASEPVAAKSLASIDAALPNEMTSCDAPLF